MFAVTLQFLDDIAFQRQYQIKTKIFRIAFVFAPLHEKVKKNLLNGVFHDIIISAKLDPIAVKRIYMQIVKVRESFFITCKKTFPKY